MKGFLSFSLCLYALNCSADEHALDNVNFVSWSVPDQAVVIRVDHKNHLIKSNHPLGIAGYSLHQVTTHYIEIYGESSIGEYLRIYPNPSSGNQIQHFSLLPSSQISE